MFIMALFIITYKLKHYGYPATGGSISVSGEALYIQILKIVDFKTMRCHGKLFIKESS